MESGQFNVLNSRYRLVEMSGIGGMATVFKAEDLLLGRLVAVKILHESLTSDSDFLDRFQREAHAAANLTHPNIVTVHDIGQDGRRYYIVMEYLEGWTLKQLIRHQWQHSDEKIPVARAVDLVIQICEGVGYAHRANLVHCDVKPQNVLVSKEDWVKVADFGIARALTETIHPDDDSIWGTPQYFSPEQALGERVSPASDVYSIGVIFFELLTGRLPFQEDSHTLLGKQHIESVPPSVTESNPLVPPQIDRIVAKVLAKSPSGRYRTAGQLAQVLKSYRDNSFAATGPVARPAPRQFVPPVSATVRSLAEEKTAPRQRRATPTPGTEAGRKTPAEKRYASPGPVMDTDWTAIALGIVALISLLGLIPLWYLVFLRFTAS